MTDTELIAVMEHVGLIPGKHWRLAKVDGKPEIVVNVDGIKLLAKHAPDQEKATKFLAALRDQGYLT